MNDLAEKALRGLDLARREIAARPVAGLSAAGFVLGAVVVVTGGRIGAAPAAVPIDRWFGLLPLAGYRITGVGMGTAMLAAIGALVAVWLLTLHLSRSRRFGDRQLWIIAACWAIPFAVGPPVLSTDVFGYVARGLLSRHGLSPYHHGPSALGDMRVVDAIDPTWRTTPSTDGPLATLGEHLAVSVSGGRVLPAVIILRAAAILSVIVIGRLAADLSGPRRPIALGLTVLNPAVLLLLVSAANIAAPLVAVLLAALTAAGQRRWVPAIVLACVAAGLKPVGLLAVAAVVAVHAVGGQARLAGRLIARDLAVAVASLAVIGLALVPFGLGWAGNLSAAAHEHVPFAPSSLIADLIGLVIPSASFDDLATGGRIAAGFAGFVVLLYLFLTLRTRPLERTIGFGLLAAALLAPVVYPAFLLWSVLCLAPGATGSRRDWMVAISAAACVLTPVGLGERGGKYATIGALVVIAAILVPRLTIRYRAALAATARAAEEARAASAEGTLSDSHPR